MLSRNPPDRSGKWLAAENSAAEWGRTIRFCLIGVVIGPWFPVLLVLGALVALGALDPKLAAEALRWLVLLGSR